MVTIIYHELSNFCHIRAIRGGHDCYHELSNLRIFELSNFCNIRVIRGGHDCYHELSNFRISATFA